MFGCLLTPMNTLRSYLTLSKTVAAMVSVALIGLVTCRTVKFFSLEACPKGQPCIAKRREPAGPRYVGLNGPKLHRWTS